MSTDHLEIPTDFSVSGRRISVTEYYNLAQIGIIGPDDRVELLDGQVVKMAPIGPRHAIVVDTLAELLLSAVAGRATVRVQNPVTLDEGSEPQPDLAVVSRKWRGYPHAHPASPDILLLIEVADTSFNTDSGAKREIYAKAGIAEFWIVDLIKNVVHLHRKPVGHSYGSITMAGPSDIIELSALPDVAIAVSTILA